jgi:hypothetical protein
MNAETTDNFETLKPITTLDSPRYAVQNSFMINTSIDRLDDDGGLNDNVKLDLNKMDLSKITYVSSNQGYLQPPNRGK